MKIDEVISVVDIKYHESMVEKGGDSKYKPEFVVYMDYDYWVECMREIGGQACYSSVAYEFFNEGTINGQRVWKIPPLTFTLNNQPIKHLPFLVFSLN